MKRFENQSAIITGGAEGLGRGIAERIAAEGGKVFLFDVNQSMLEKTIQDFKNNGFDAGGFVVDVSSESSVADGIRQVEEKTGQVHIMVNAAGIVGLSNTKIADYPVEDYDNIYRVNLRGSFLMTKYAIKAMEKYNYGRILLIASIAGKEGNPFMTGY
jgi:NAD(P)-dependent dehydrogenase (short-subunit alcohol dehydrogenase family)